MRSAEELTGWNMVHEWVWAMAPGGVGTVGCAPPSNYEGTFVLEAPTSNPNPTLCVAESTAAV